MGPLKFEEADPSSCNYNYVFKFGFLEPRPKGSRHRGTIATDGAEAGSHPSLLPALLPPLFSFRLPSMLLPYIFTIPPLLFPLSPPFPFLLSSPLPWPCILLRGLVSEIHSRQRLRSASSTDVVVPATRRSSLGDRAFPVAGARAWNALPPSVSSAPSLFIQHFCWQICPFFGGADD